MTLNIVVNLKVDTALTIGSGAKGTGLVDIFTLRNNSGDLIIPASTLKGRLRWECERILKAMGYKDICIPPKAEEMCPHFHGFPKREVYCPICLLFGSPGREGSLYFTDLLWEWKDKETKNTEIRPGVAISRSRGVAEDDKLYWMETSLHGVEPTFQGKIEGVVRELKEVALLRAGIEAIFALGMGKSGGLGWVKKEEDEKPFSSILWNGKEFAEDDFIKGLEEWRNG